MILLQSNQIFTDSYVTQTLLGVIAFLITGSMALVAYIWNSRQKQYELARLEEQQYRKSLDEKFTAINGFMLTQIEKNMGFQKDIEQLDEKIDRFPKRRSA